MGVKSAVWGLQTKFGSQRGGTPSCRFVVEHTKRVGAVSKPNKRTCRNITAVSGPLNSYFFYCARVPLLEGLIIFLILVFCLLFLPTHYGPNKLVCVLSLFSPLPKKTTTRSQPWPCPGGRRSGGPPRVRDRRPGPRALLPAEGTSPLGKGRGPPDQPPEFQPAYPFHPQNIPSTVLSFVGACWWINPHTSNLRFLGGSGSLGKPLPKPPHGLRAACPRHRRRNCPARVPFLAARRVQVVFF